MTIILASQSPRRRELIQLLNMPYSTTAVHVNEDSVQLADLVANVQARALLKAQTLQEQIEPQDALILAADTTVALGEQMLNKPNDAAHAKEMLLSLKNKNHQVHSGVVILPDANREPISFVNTSIVTMRNYSDKEIDTYIKTGNPFDKAGAYAIQHNTFDPVEQLSGCYLGVMGLPICQLILKLRELNIFPKFNLNDLKVAHGRFASCPDLEKLNL